MLPCEVKDSRVQRLSNVHSSLVLVDAQVVDIERFDICQDIVIEMLLEDAEGVALQTVVLIYGGEDWSGLIFQDLFELLIRVFSLSVVSQVGAHLVVDQGDLRQQLMDPSDIFL